jgi:putative membrane-bound dehydrogenase-like protein
VELVASEPLISSPVALSIDERGRMFVVEMIDYSERREITPHLGRIVMLEDTNGDGVYDKSTVYADNLPWPTAVFCYDGGIFVGATPDIIYFKDTKGDGKADKREVVFTGFAEGQPRVNVQGMLNSFIWGLDNRIHGSSSEDGGVGRMLRHPEMKPLELHWRDFVIEPRTMVMTTEAGGGQHGVSYDDWGRRFTCNNSDNIRLYMYDDYYAGRNPFYAMPPALASIAVDGPAAQVYRISPEESWRVIRTRWRIAGLVGGPVEGGGRSAGYFTSASGLKIYRGDAFPPEYRDNAFIGEPAGNLVHRKVLTPDDVGLKAERGPGEETNEFLASTDTWFRPVQFANAPDGTLYAIDMYREIIEHPWSLPDNIKKLVDLDSGNNRGRIYRIAPDGFKEPPFHRLDRMTIKELVATLASPNGWYQDTASRLIYERQDKSAVPELVKLLETSPSALGRLHAMCSLDGLRALKEEHVLRALKDPEAGVREHAIKLSEKFIANSLAPKKLWATLMGLTGDPSLNVRFQLAFTLGELRNTGRLEALGAIVKHDASSPWIQAAALSSLAEGANEMFANLSSDLEFGRSPHGQEFLRQLVTLVGAKNNRAEVADALAYIMKTGDTALSFSLIRALGDGLEKSGGSLFKVDADGKLKAVFAQAATVAADPKADEAARREAIQLLAFTSYGDSGKMLLEVLHKDPSEAVQVAAVTTLAKFNDPQVAAELIKGWPDYPDRVKGEVKAALLGRPEKAIALLHAIQEKKLRTDDLTTAQIKFVRNHRDDAVRKLAAKVFASYKMKSRQSVVDSYQPALSLTGDAAKGKQIYLQRCSQCHRLGGNGYQVGPDLVTVKSAGKDKNLINIMDPNREVAPQYIAFTIESTDDESLVGVIGNETTSSVTVRQPFGKENTLMRSNIKSMQSQGQSLMPEGLEQGLSQQDVANLLEYIATADAK